jgi:hypothetical protein
MKENTYQKGAYDKRGVWWFEEEINSFTNGIVKMFFNKEKQNIKIIERKIKKHRLV